MNTPQLTPDYLDKEIPFRNVQEFYPDGKVRTDRFFSDGEILFKEVLYSETGCIKEITNYRRDGTVWSKQIFEEDIKKSGLAISYYEDGSVQSQKYYVNNKIHWKEKIFNKNGQLIEIISYSKGTRDGENIAFDEKGRKISILNYKYNIPDGPARFYYENGQLKAEMNFEKGEKTGESKIYFKNGILKIQEKLTHNVRDGITKTYYESGGIKEEWAFKNGFLDGRSRFFFKDGTIFGEKSYEKGLEEGYTTLYYHTGKIKEEINYSRGIKSGPTKIYSEDGRLEKEIIYEDGRVAEEKTVKDKPVKVVKEQVKIEPKPHEIEIKKETGKTKIRKRVNYAVVLVGGLLLIYFIYILTIYLL